MFSGLFTNLTEEDKNSAIEGIIQHATPRKDFFLMLTLAVSMASFGVLLGNTVILIGSMLIAPLLYPLLSLSLGIIVSDDKLIARSVYTLFKSVIYSLAAGFVIGLLFSNREGISLSFGMVVTGMSSPLMYAIVAAIAGFAAAFAMTKPHLNETLPGVAISAALVPPLASAGLALSTFQWSIFNESLLLFLVNGIGIMFSAMIVFSLLRFAVKKTVTKQVVKEEEKIIAKEEQKIPSV